MSEAVPMKVAARRYQSLKYAPYTYLNWSEYIVCYKIVPDQYCLGVAKRRSSLQIKKLTIWRVLSSIV